MFWYVLLALLMLGIMIMVHEAGHFLAARLCGIPVKEFSIGFGPKLWQRKSKKSGTLFSLRPIPLGGFCMFYGDTDDDPEGKSVDDPRNLKNFPAWKRLLSVAAGPLTNLLLALLVAFVVTAGWGQAVDRIIAPKVLEVSAGSPAETAGLQAGDLILSEDDLDLRGKTAQEMVEQQHFTGEPVVIRYQRDGEELETELTPLYSEEEERYLMGVTLSTDLTTRYLTAAEIPAQAWSLYREAAAAIVQGIASLFRGTNLIENSAGPVGVVSMVAQQTREYGISQYLYLLAVLSINLGLLNLLPIPGLDGAHIVFLLIEMIFRRPVPQKTQAIIHMIGYVLLIALMLVITGKDILRLFQ